MALTNRLRDHAPALQGDLVRLRRDLHRHPEIGLDLPHTQQLVLDALDGLGLEITRGRGLSSVTAVLRGGHPGPAVLLRADMDALPITEATGLDYASQVDGVMHACGHDLHTAILVGAARLLSSHRDALHGDVVFMFQPGEEGFNGAGRMIEEGVLDAAGRRVSSAYALHVRSYGTPRGLVTSRPGTVMAAVDELRVTVHGVGAHASMPHQGRDPVTAAAEMVTALQTLVTRRFNVFDPVVVTVGSFHAGHSVNTIPDTARFAATVRTFSAANQAVIRTEAGRLCEHIAQAYGLTAEVEYVRKYPVTVNDAQQYEFAGRVVSDVLGAERFAPMPFPAAAAEDFSRVLDEVPGCYLILGASAADDPAAAAMNHSPRAAFDDAVLADGALVLAELATRALARDAAAAQR
ncbi:M20 family metallopeptidase [Micromonospora krabiensis]|uniref:Hippurate hydrolase n=1 Tax=Micromonospora krabiensis TaxID=307121 RepID=A0A1C3NE72_9ACTN|nr:M20 family metallopeptidase [Micromonospora krabiensis]SBV30894.1 hippurate hydrolase [Micromonospora krabiensis]